MCYRFNSEWIRELPGECKIACVSTSIIHVDVPNLREFFLVLTLHILILNLRNIKLKPRCFNRFSQINISLSYKCSYHQSSSRSTYPMILSSSIYPSTAVLKEPIQVAVFLDVLLFCSINGSLSICEFKFCPHI